jgi:hypothetical protein
MRLESARELKQNLFETVLAPGPLQLLAQSVGTPARPLPQAVHSRLLAVGITRRAGGDYVLAVRVQSQLLVGSEPVARIVEQARGEAEVRYIGRVHKLQAPWQQLRTRPLKIGVSVGHYQITAGTLGCFVRATDATGGVGVMGLSNNHVLANENQAARGDDILQPGAYDGGKRPDDVVAQLDRFEALRISGSNVVDCAAAALAEGIGFDAGTITGAGTLTGVAEEPAGDDAVAKMGRTTGLTRGRVTAFEVDNLVISYDSGDLRFDNQIEVESTGSGPFSQGGDSGSLIVDGAVKGLALLFAGSDTGGTNGLGLTYANPFRDVLARLNVELVTG